MYLQLYGIIAYTCIFNGVTKIFITENKLLQQINENSSLQLYGERVMVEKMLPTKQLQLICTSTNPSATIEVDMLMSYFNSPECTGKSHFSSLQSVDVLDVSGEKPIYIVTYSTQQGKHNILNSSNSVCWEL